jgi:hypothetical protein
VAAAAVRDALECEDAWGRADALHPLGVAEARATAVLTEALDLRRDLGHPGVAETAAALDALET